MELENYSNSNPYVFAKNISRSAVNAVSENTQGVSGVEIQTYLTEVLRIPTLHRTSSAHSVRCRKMNTMS